MTLSFTPSSNADVSSCPYFPQNGVFDELPKTGLCRSLAKTAQRSPETVGFHTRVVRGESRIVKFLQMVQDVLQRRNEGYNSGAEYIVKMFDDLEMSGKNQSLTKLNGGWFKTQKMKMRQKKKKRCRRFLTDYWSLNP